MLRAGDKVGDRYVVIEQIAAGGMGTLWRAHHVDLDVDVALKVLSVDAASPDLLKRFKHEAQASARLRSPKIVQVLDYGVHEDQPYLAKELLRGMDLEARLTAEGRLSIQETAPIVQAVARAMQVAHDAHIVHRDVKPANIFLEKIGDEVVVKVLDFGVAKDLRPNSDASRTTGSGVVGSPAYMSPEQVWGEKVDSRTDVWAMAVVTFEMLTGHCPFADETLAKIFERIIRSPIPKIRDFNPALPPSLDAFFDKALARAPADRIASAREFDDAFRGAVTPLDAREGEPSRPAQAELLTTTQNAPYAATERPPPPAPEKPGNVSRSRALWLSAIAVALLGAFVSFVLTRPPTPLAPRREAAALPATATSAMLEPSARDAPPVGPSAVTAQASGSLPPAPPPTVSATTSRPAGRAPKAAGSILRVDPQFGLPQPSPR